MTNGISERLKQQLTIIILAALCIPFFFFVNLPQSFSLTNLSLYGALITGFVGIVVLLAQFFLGTRSITGLVYRDLPWTLQIHKNIGIYGTLLIFAHPVLMLVPYARNLLYVIVPDFSTSFETSVTWGRIALFALLAVWVTSALVRGRIKYRPWKYTHYLGYIVLPLAFIHSPPIGRSLTGSHALLLYWYALAVIYLVLLALRLRHIFGYSKRQYEILSVSRLSEDSILMRLKSPEGLQTIHNGQYVYIQRSLSGEEHPFSIVDFNIKTGEMLVAFKMGGAFTDKLGRMEAGNSVLVDGPYGTFTKELTVETNLPRVYIAGGIGITPFIRSILAAGADTEQYLFFCNRKVSSSIFRRQLQQKMGARHIDVLSGDASTQGQNIEPGRISDIVIAKYLSDPARYDYFICGPKPMMDQARRSLLNLGISTRRIHTEEFSF